MSDLKIKFRNHPELLVELRPGLAVQKYKTLIQQSLATGSPIYRDPNRYNIKYLRTLAQKAKNILGWEWVKDRYELADTVQMHKDLEQYLANGFANIPEEYDDLMHELHFCLHKIEGGEIGRGQWIQIEWFNDLGFSITPDDIDFKLTLDFGDIRLQNPYVGHTPLMVYGQNDYTNIHQTCRFHDLARPGINIIIESWQPAGDFTLKKYTDWFKNMAPTFVHEHGVDKILSFTGHPVVGRILNLEDLARVCASPLLDLESVVVN